MAKLHVSKLKYKGQEESMNYSDDQIRSSASKICTHTIDSESWNTDQSVAPSGSKVFDYSYLIGNNRLNQIIGNNHFSLKEINVFKSNGLPENSIQSASSSFEKSCHKKMWNIYLKINSFIMQWMQKVRQKHCHLERKISLFSQVLWLSVVMKSRLIGLILFGKF